MTGLDIAGVRATEKRPLRGLPRTRVFRPRFSVIALFLFVFPGCRPRSIKMVYLELDFRPISRLRFETV